ncbi:hypothetical protein AAHB34_17355 [Paenarthrobacter ureafaciens]
MRGGGSAVGHCHQPFGAVGFDAAVAVQGNDPGQGARSFGGAHEPRGGPGSKTGLPAKERGDHAVVFHFPVHRVIEVPADGGDAQRQGKLPGRRRTSLEACTRTGVARGVVRPIFVPGDCAGAFRRFSHRHGDGPGELG